jgi:PP-loop superfamily ATP-utilizing enzyme
LDVPPERLAEILRDHGLAGARLESAGSGSEIAVLAVGPEDWDRLLGDEGVALSARLKELGFRHVALELDEGEVAG